MSLGAEARDSIVEQKMGSTIPVRPRAETIGSQYREEKVREREYGTMWKGPYGNMATKRSQVERGIDTIIECYVPCAVVALLDINSSSDMFPRKWTKR